MQEKNEKEILADYLKNGECQTLDGEDATLLEIFKGNATSFQNSEAPDILLQCDGVTYGIEHFMVDSSDCTDGGSSIQKKLLYISQNIDYSSGESMNFDNNPSLEFYECCLEKSINKHATKISRYMNSVGPVAKFVLIFFIEDKTPLENICFVDNQKQWLTAIDSKCFLGAMHKYKAINHFLYGYTVQGGKKLLLINNNEQTREKLNKYQSQDREMLFLNGTAVATSFQVDLSPEETEIFNESGWNRGTE